MNCSLCWSLFPPLPLHLLFCFADSADSFPQGSKLIHFFNKHLSDRRSSGCQGQTKHRTNTDQVVNTYWLDWKSSALMDLLPMNYFPPKSNPSLIHIFKWRWDSHYLKLVLLKCNSVALNAFRMLGNHIDLVLERFHDSESNPECVKQYPAHTSLLTAPGRHSSAFCLSLWICLFWTVHTSGIIPYVTCFVWFLPLS